MRDWAVIIFALIVILGMITVRHHREDDCRAKGGVYLTHELKCVKGIQEIR